MIYRGTVRRGVIELEGGEVLPDGTRVNIEPLTMKNEGGPDTNDPLFDMRPWAVDTGVEDLATNIDHYLYGHPKVNRDG